MMAEETPEIEAGGLEAKEKMDFQALAERITHMEKIKRTKLISLNAPKSDLNDGWCLCFMEQCSFIEITVDRLMTKSEFTAHTVQFHGIKDEETFNKTKRSFGLMILHRGLENVTDLTRQDITPLISFLEKWKKEKASDMRSGDGSKKPKSNNSLVCVSGCSIYFYMTFDQLIRLRTNHLKEHSSQNQKPVTKELFLRLIYKDLEPETQDAQNLTAPISTVPTVEPAKRLVDVKRAPSSKRATIILTCQSCKCEFRILSNPSNHKELYLRKFDYECSQCEKSNRSTQTKIQHSPVCNLCTVDVVKVHYMEAHEVRLERYFQCKSCGAKCRDKDEVNRHMNQSHVKPLK